MKTKQFNSIFKVWTLFGVLLFLSACNTNAAYKEDINLAEVDLNEEYDGLSGFVGNESIQVDSNMEPAPEFPKDLKIIKSAEARYKVENVKEATRKIKGVAQKYNAYISDLRFNNNLYKLENRFTVKVPQQHFDALMDSIAGVVSFVEYENITTKDVTEEYIDLESRLKTKLEVKARYEEVLRKNAKTVKDILATEEKLRVIQEEIESAQGRLKYLTNKVAFSTIVIDLYETVEYTPEPSSYEKSFGDKSKNGFSFGWNMIESGILFLIHIWPLLLFGTLLFFFLRRKMKK
ncbi:MAG: DUF4349 domain-containing protein [Bacteroidota bacterium]